MKVAFLTLGCKVNSYETDLLRMEFEKAGHTVVDFSDVADLYVINSCSVTNMSDRKTRQMVSRARHTNISAIVAVVGCSVEGRKDEKDNFKDADIILGNEDKLDLLNIVTEYVKNNVKKEIKLQDISKVKRYKEVQYVKKAYEIREEIKIEDGCNNFCSYCIIPYIRGRVRSRSLESIKKEAEELVKQGVKEIVLVGIEVASYGKDLEEGTLFDVLECLENIDGLDRIRLSSMEPRFLNEENIKKLSTYKKLCSHFHISMQSGNTCVIHRMNRKYTKEDLICMCNNLRKYFVNLYLAADVIVGFPMESDTEFLDTVDTIEKMKLTKIHVFKYSKRKYTRASKMAGQVDGNVKKRRSDILLKLSDKLSEEFLSKYIGKKVSVLFENYTEGVLTGFTQNYIKCKVEGDETLCGTIQDVVVRSLGKDIILGNLD